MMTIEEAISHCKEKACGNTECAAEHKQLAEWLTELKRLKDCSKPNDIAEFLNRLAPSEQEFLWGHIEAVKKLEREEVIDKAAEWLDVFAADYANYDVYDCRCRMSEDFIKTFRKEMSNKV